MFDFEFDPYDDDSSNNELTNIEMLDAEQPQPSKTDNERPGKTIRKSKTEIVDTKASLDVEAPTHEACPKCKGTGRWFFYKQRTWHTCARCAGYREMNPINQERWERYNKPEYKQQREQVRQLRESGTVKNVKADFAEWTDFV